MSLLFIILIIMFTNSCFAKDGINPDMFSSDFDSYSNYAKEYKLQDVVQKDLQHVSGLCSSADEQKKSFNATINYMAGDAVFTGSKISFDILNEVVSPIKNPIADGLVNAYTASLDKIAGRSSNLQSINNVTVQWDKVFAKNIAEGTKYAPKIEVFSKVHSAITMANDLKEYEKRFSENFNEIKHNGNPKSNEIIADNFMKSVVSPNIRELNSLHQQNNQFVNSRCIDEFMPTSKNTSFTREIDVLSKKDYAVANNINRSSIEYSHPIPSCELPKVTLTSNIPKSAFNTTSYPTSSVNSYGSVNNSTSYTSLPNVRISATSTNYSNGFINKSDFGGNRFQNFNKKW